MTRVGVLFVLTSPVRGGVEEVVLALLQRLDPSEFRLALAAPPPLLDSFAPDLRGVALETAGVRAQSWTRREDVARLSAFIRGVRPHVVNPHLFRSMVVAAPLAKWHGARVVETYHGREGWRGSLLRGGFLPDRLVARLADRVIAVSEAARAFLVHGKGYPADRIVVVPNGRDLSTFRPGAGREAVRKELELDRTVPLVGVVGRLEPQKGHAHLLAAWPSIVAEFPDARLLVDVDLSIFGAAKPRFEEYERQIRHEYSWVPEDVFCERRVRILTSFLDRPAIYGTPYYASRLETRARENLRRSLARLGRIVR